MAALYCLTNEAIELHEKLLAYEAGNTGALLDEQGQSDVKFAKAYLEEAFASIKDQVADKSDDYCWVIKDLDAKAEAYKAREQEFRLKRQINERAVERLKAALVEAMTTLGVDKIKGADYSLALQNSPPSCYEIKAEEALANGFAEKITTIKVDSRKIIEAWKANPEIITFAKVAQNKHVRIR